jgi:hypothetical protein
MKKYYKYKGTEFSVEESDRKGKQLVATFKDGKKIHFGDPDMPEYIGTKRGDNYCSRTRNLNSPSIKNANSLSRKILWNCNGNKSETTKKKAGISLISMEDFYE